MTHTLVIPEWGIHITTKSPIFVVVGVKSENESEEGFSVFLGISLADTEEEALAKLSEEEKSSFDAYGAYSLFTVLNEAYLLDKAQKIIDAVKHKK